MNTTSPLKPIYYLPADRCPVTAGKDKRMPSGVTHWCREGDTFWHKITENLESPEPCPEELPDYVQFHPNPW